MFPYWEIFIFDEILKMNKFEVEFLPEVEKFLDELEFKAKEKIYFNIKKSQIINDSGLFKKLNDNIWEFRTLYNGKAYRLFSFWDVYEKSLVVATHGLIKKTQKTPKNEIEKAEKIRKEYLEYKKKENEK